MTYEETGAKQGKRHSLEYELSTLSTATILWHVVRKHKFGLVATYAIVMTPFVLMPSFGTFIVSLFQ